MLRLSRDLHGGPSSFKAYELCKTPWLQLMDPLECHVIICLFIKVYIRLRALGMCLSQNIPQDSGDV